VDYFEDFETNPISWRSGKSPDIAANSWKIGNPSKGFTGASSGTKCWYTYIPAYPAPREQSWVTSPCFDFSGMERPMVKMDIWRLFNSNRDGANIQASADSGKTWINVGQIGDGIKWFNSYNIIGNPGGSSVGWSNNTSGTLYDTYWVEARHALDMLKGKKDVQFRVAYGSDINAQGNNGIAFDDFWIGERNRMALIEHFTNSSDAESADADAALNDLVNNNELSIIDLQYHTSSPSGDPFNGDNHAISDARQFYYGLSGVPYAMVNGGTKSEQRIDFGDPLFEEDELNAITVEYLRDSKFWINLNSKVLGNTLIIEAEVFALEAIPTPVELTVHLAVKERVVTGITGNNGETQFESVVKALLPDAGGTTIYKSWTQGESSFVTENWNLQHVYDTSELRVVAFIQSEATQEVYQVAMDTIGVFTGINDYKPGNSGDQQFIVYPNPVENSVFIRFTDTPLNEVKFELFNNMGSLVHTEQIPAGTEVAKISAEGLPDGVYLLRLIHNNQLLGIRKLIITN
jgi:hypothetical protein